MPTFAQIQRGKRARERVTLMLDDGRVDQTGAIVGTTVALDVRVLTPNEQIEVFEKARAYARLKGSDKPETGDEIYDLALWAYTCLFACIDFESPDASPRPFFESLEQILSGEDFTSDHICYLYERWQAWQDKCSPRVFSMDSKQAIEAVVKLAQGSVEDSALFLALMRPAMRAGFLHFTAKLLWNSPTGRSLLFGTSSDVVAN